MGKAAGERGGVDGMATRAYMQWFLLEARLLILTFGTASSISLMCSPSWEGGI